MQIAHSGYPWFCGCTAVMKTGTYATTGAFRGCGTFSG